MAALNPTATSDRLISVVDTVMYGFTSIIGETRTKALALNTVFAYIDTVEKTVVAFSQDGSNSICFAPELGQKTGLLATAELLTLLGFYESEYDALCAIGMGRLITVRKQVNNPSASIEILSNRN